MVSQSVYCKHWNYHAANDSFEWSKDKNDKGPYRFKFLFGDESLLSVMMNFKYSHPVDSTSSLERLPLPPPCSSSPPPAASCSIDVKVIKEICGKFVLSNVFAAPDGAQVEDIQQALNTDEMRVLLTAHGVNYQIPLNV